MWLPLFGGSFVSVFFCLFQNNLCGFYHTDETEAEREQKRLEKAKRRALSSSVIRELKEQYSDAPEEIRDARHPHVTRQSQEDQHRSEFLNLEIPLDLQSAVLVLCVNMIKSGTGKPTC